MTAHIRNANVVSGTRTSAAGTAPSRLKVDMGDLYMLEDDEGALFVVANMLGSQPASRETISWHARELRPKFTQITNGPFNAAATTIEVTNASYLTVGMLIKHAVTGEVLEVTVDNGGGSFDVLRTVGSTPAGGAGAIDFEDDDEILILGDFYGEYAGLNDPQTVIDVEYTNKVALKRDNFTFSGTMKAITEKGGTYHGNVVEEARREMLKKHKRDWNLTGMFSEENDVVLGSDATKRSMEGIIPFITANGSNRVNNTAALTEAAWNDGLKDAFRYGSSKKVAVMSRAFAGILDTLAFGSREISPSETMFGLRLNQWRSTHGDIAMVVDNALEGDEYDQYCLILDMDEMGGPKWRPLRETTMIVDRNEDGDLDGIREEVLTEGSIEHGNPDWHYLFDSVTS